MAETKSFAGLVETPFTRRFGVVALVPSITLVGFLILLLLSGAPQQAPSLEVLAERFEALTLRQLLLLAALTVIGALVLHPLQFPLVQFLEGYWGTGRLSRALWRLASARQVARRDRIRAAIRQWDQLGSAVETSDARIWAGREAIRLQRSLPEVGHTMPTRLGATLKAYEERAGSRYGIPAVSLILRIYSLMDPTQRQVYDDFRNQLDTAAGFTAVWLISTAIAAALLVWHGLWIAVAFVTLGLAWASYRAAIAAAQGFGDMLEASIDLYRFDAYQALHLPIPSDLVTERAHNRDVYEVLMGRSYPNITYSHPPKTDQ